MELLTLIDKEIKRLEEARGLLSGMNGAASVKRGPGRPKGSGKKKRRMSAEGRARLVAAVKARLARQKKAAAK
jgi:hypothetical protein